MKPLVVGLLLFAAAGCASPVSGVASGVETTVPSTSSREKPSETKSASASAGTSTAKPTRSATPSTAPATTPSAPSADIAAIEAAPAQLCDQRFKGALGKDMLAAVVQTPAGRLTCDQAGAVLYDYYVERPEPDTTGVPIEVGGLTCAQVPEPAVPQVVCTDGSDVIYSLWPQGQ